MKTPRAAIGGAEILTAIAALALAAGGCRSAAPVAGEPTAQAALAEAGPAEEAAGGGDDDDAKVYDNTVKWTTATELDNFGFDVYRSESADGPFERINPEVIEGAGTVDEPRSYRYVDDTIDPRKTYYYYVESISMSGVREQFTPIGKAGPKIPPAEDGQNTTDPPGGEPR